MSKYILVCCFMLFGLVRAGQSFTAELIVCSFVHHLSKKFDGSRVRGGVVVGGGGCCRLLVAKSPTNMLVCVSGADLFTICYLTQSQDIDIGPTSPRTDPIMLGAWLGSHYSISFKQRSSITGLPHRQWERGWWEGVGWGLA